MVLSEKNNITPTLWGSYFWNTIHFASFGYPTNPTPSDKDAYRDFYVSIGKVLPCDACSMSYSLKVSNDMDSLTEGLKNRESLINWAYDIHNWVNNKLGKTYFATNVNDFKKHFMGKFKIEIDEKIKKELDYKELNTKNDNLVMGLLILILIIIVLISILCINKFAKRHN